MIYPLPVFAEFELNEVWDFSNHEKVCFNLDFMGIELDSEKNEIKTHEPREISKNSSKTKIFVIPTNEELVIAKDTYNLVK